MSYQAIDQKLKAGEMVILDGAIGTEILRRNVTWADHQLANRPDFVRGIHEDYIRAGADVISTNSFQLCRRALYNHFRDEAHRQQIGAADLGDRADKLLAASVHLAVDARAKAAAGRPVAVAAAITTLEWCFRPDLAPSPEQARCEYLEIFQVVKDAGADLVLLETLNSISEARAALEVAKEPRASLLDQLRVRRTRLVVHRREHGRDGGRARTVGSGCHPAELRPAGRHQRRDERTPGARPGANRSLSSHRAI